MMDSTPAWDDTKPVASRESPEGNPPTWEGTQDLQEAHGTPLEQAKAGVEALERGLSFGLSDVARTQLDPYVLPESLQSKAEDIRAREVANPITSAAGNMLGGAASIGALGPITGGIAAPIEASLTAKGVAPLAARVAGFGLEGGAFGAGNAVSDAALGDPNLNAQKVLAHIGMGAAIGSGLGVLSKGIEAVPALLRSAPENAPPPVAAAAPDAVPPIVEAADRGIKPTSLDEIKAQNDQALKYGGETVELPQKAALTDALSRLDMEPSVNPLQVNSLENQEARDLYNTARELPGEDGKALRTLEARQKNYLVKTTDKTVADIAPDAEVTSDATKGGNQAIKYLSENYQKEKAALEPILDTLDQADVGHNVDHLPGVVRSFTDAVPGVARMFDTESGAIKIKPYSTAWGIDESTYRAVKQAVNALEENPDKFRDLMNIRDGLSQHVDILSQGQGPEQIRALKAAMMDYVQKAVQESTPDINVRDVFRRWAINEQERAVIEKVFGASVGSKEFGAISKIKPETILDRIFSNTANVKAAKAMLTPEQFNHLLANHLAEQRALATTDNVFSSHKFGSWLKRNQDVLNEAFRENPATLQKIQDLNTVARILPDAKSINPSGTAKTLLGSLNAHSAYELLKNVGEHVLEAIKQKQLVEQVNAELAGKADQAAKLKSIEGMLEKIGSRIKTAAKEISNPAKAAAAAGVIDISNKTYDDHIKRIKQLSGDPTAMLDHASSSTQALYGSAPNISQGIQTAMMNAVQFLDSKIPKKPDQFYLSRPWEPSQAQKLQFARYFEAVNDPVSVLDQVKSGTLTNDAMEALSAVHPDLLNEFRSQVLEHLKPEKAKDLPYSTKLAISKLIGQPLDENMTLAMVQANQLALNGPSLSNQSAPQDGRKVNQAGMQKMKLASRTATTIQRDDLA